MKNMWILIFVMIASSCSTTDKPATPDSSIPNYLEELDKQYPYLPIRLNPFVVEDKIVSKPDATEEDNRSAKKIDIKEKEYMLKHLDLMRFVINTPEFEAAVLDPDYKFRAGRTATGTYGSIREGDHYDKTKLLALLKYASITTYFMKTDVGADAVALGKAGPSYYVDVDLLNNPSKGPWNTDALIMFPNREYWADGEYGYGQEFPANIDIVALMFHELMHNLGAKHGAEVHHEDTAYVMQDIFRATTSDPEWRNKYRKQVKEYNYYQTKYKDYLTSPTIPE